ncbi:MAG: hypothetical protein HYS69_16430 [candidate division NC10 bacterium]|nr:hypothetical protein [candidate division NC10 bacterium]
MSRIYRIDDGWAVRERQRALPKGIVAEAWPDVFEPGTFWISQATKRLLDGAGGPLTPSAVVEGSRIPIYFPEGTEERDSLPSEESLRVRVLAGHGIAVIWYGTPSRPGGRPLPEPTSPEDAFFTLMKMGSRVNHLWRLFRTRHEAVEFMGRHFPQDARARTWAEALAVARYSELLSPGSA